MHRYIHYVNTHTYTHMYRYVCIFTHTYTYTPLLPMPISVLLFHLSQKFTKEGQESVPLKPSHMKDGVGAGIFDKDRCLVGEEVTIWKSVRTAVERPGGPGSLQKKICLKDRSLPRRDKLTSCTGRDLLEASACHLQGPWGLYADPLEKEEAAGAIPCVEVVLFHSLRPLSPLSDFGQRAVEWSQQRWPPFI